MICRSAELKKILLYDIGKLSQTENEWKKNPIVRSAFSLEPGDDIALRIYIPTFSIWSQQKTMMNGTKR